MGTVFAVTYQGNLKSLPPAEKKIVLGILGKYELHNPEHGCYGADRERIWSEKPNQRIQQIPYQFFRKTDPNLEAVLDIDAHQNRVLLRAQVERSYRDMHQWRPKIDFYLDGMHFQLYADSPNNKEFFLFANGGTNDLNAVYQAYLSNAQTTEPRYAPLPRAA